MTRKVGTSKGPDGAVRASRVDPYRLRVEREGGMRVDALLYATEGISIEPDALGQIRDAARMPSVEFVFATPDIHLGYGVPIGCVMATRDVVSPAAVGYDINCGMRLLTTPLDASEVDVEALAQSIRRDVPLGEGKRNLRLSREDLARVLDGGVPALADLAGDLGRYGRIRRLNEEREDALRIEDGGTEPGRAESVSARAMARGAPQLGTLGGGNHFIELQVVDQVEDDAAATAFGLRPGQLVVMIHTGSRGFGHQVAGDYMKAATRLHAEESPSKHLAFLGSDEPEGRRYLEAMSAAANFAFANRQVISAHVRHAIRARHGEDMELPLVYDVTHNMAKREEHGGRDLLVHRKGATRAFPKERMTGTPFAHTGQPVIIPGSMGTASYLMVAGERASEALCSVNHGAGRVMSRTAARGKRTRSGKVVREGLVSQADLRSAMEGITLIAEDRRAVVEEAPQAYKDIGLVIEAVTGAGLARVVARMRPLAVLKG